MRLGSSTPGWCHRGAAELQGSTEGGSEDTPGRMEASESRGLSTGGSAVVGEGSGLRGVPGSHPRCCQEAHGQATASKEG
eukprot:5858149-Alexandrium_andersonii.AAC.1